MKYEEFMKITEKWSYTHQVGFLMETEEWCDAIMAFIKDNWMSIEKEYISWYAEEHNMTKYTKLEEDE